jgi:hypothetical protein
MIFNSLRKRRGSTQNHQQSGKYADDFFGHVWRKKRAAPIAPISTKMT